MSDRMSDVFRQDAYNVPLPRPRPSPFEEVASRYAAEIARDKARMQQVYAEWPWVQNVEGVQLPDRRTLTDRERAFANHYDTAPLATMSMVARPDRFTAAQEQWPMSVNIEDRR